MSSLFNMFSTRLICFWFIFIIGFSPSCIGLRCESKRKSVTLISIDETVIACPALFGDKDEKFCCSKSDGSLYCCDAAKFMEEYGTGFIIPMFVVLMVALALVCCVCCLCCPCCLWYKKRNRGTVYNNIPVTMAAQPAVPPHSTQAGMYQQQMSPYPVMPMPQLHAPLPYPPAVPPHGMPMPQQYPPSPYPPTVPPHGIGQLQPPPPSYHDAVAPEAYKQAPYNPNF